MRLELDTRDAGGWRLAMTLDMPGELHAVWGVWRRRDDFEWERPVRRLASRRALG
jgi:hypothetical protein